MSTKTLVLLGAFGAGIYLLLKRPAGAIAAESAVQPPPDKNLAARLEDIGRITGRGAEILGDPDYAAALSGISPNVGRDANPPDATDPDAVAAASGLVRRTVSVFGTRRAPSRANATVASTGNSAEFDAIVAQAHETERRRVAESLLQFARRG